MLVLSHMRVSPLSSSCSHPFRPGVCCYSFFFLCIDKLKLGARTPDQTIASRNILVSIICCFLFLCQLLETFQNGPFGLNVAWHVAVELNSVTDHAPIHDQKTMEPNARDQLMKQGHVLLKCAQHQVTVLRVLYQIVVIKNNQTVADKYVHCFFWKWSTVLCTLFCLVIS